MKKQLFKILIFSAFVAGIFISKNASSQTAGTMTFNVTPVSHNAGYGLEHVMAVWIENGSGTFVKTRTKLGGTSNCNSHLLVWKAKSTSNTTDAVTGSTLTSYVPRTYTWVGNDKTGTSPYNLLPDGNYKVWIQYSWDDPPGSSTNDTVSIQFSKGPTAFTSSLANVTNFTGISVTWTPAAQNTLSITSTPANAYCTGANLNITFSKSGTTTVYRNNVWTAQLSDASGSFASPVTIGTLTDSLVGTIAATIPLGTAYGTAYRIRVVGSQPSTIGADNGTNLTISPAPTAPVVGTITQPTCSVIASVVLSGLPAAGTWTINPGNITGTGATYTVSNLAAGTYNFTVTSACISPASANVLINAAPPGPPAPVVGAITQATCTVLTGSVILSGLPAVGSWTINPGNITGTGTSHTVTGVPVGNNTFTVADTTGCASVPSANVFIDPQFTVPTPPVADSILQPSCTVPTGSILLGGLPAVGTWTLNPGSLTGTGTSHLLAGLPPGSYSATVTNAAGCTSAMSATTVINAPPTPPATPTITNDILTNILHSSAASGNQWYNLTTGAISGANNQDYTVTTNGSYFVIISVSGCNSDSSNIITITNVGIEANQNHNSINVYPNPVANQLVIEIKGNTSNTRFEILNSNGQMVFKGNMTEKTVVETSNFAPGLYMIKLENGKTFEFKKVIKE